MCFHLSTDPLQTKKVRKVPPGLPSSVSGRSSTSHINRFHSELTWADTHTHTSATQTPTFSTPTHKESSWHHPHSSWMGIQLFFRSFEELALQWHQWCLFIYKAKLWHFYLLFKGFLFVFKIKMSQQVPSLRTFSVEMRECVHAWLFVCTRVHSYMFVPLYLEVIDFQCCPVTV